MEHFNSEYLVVLLLAGFSGWDFSQRAVLKIAQTLQNEIKKHKASKHPCLQLCRYK